MKTWIGLATCLMLAAPASAGAMAHACMSSPSSLPKEKCICLEHELRKVLSADEMRIEILAFKGKYSEFRKKTKAMGDVQAASFRKRVQSVTGGAVCNR